MLAVLRAFEARPMGPLLMVQESIPEPAVVTNGLPTPDTQTAADLPDGI